MIDNHLYDMNVVITPMGLPIFCSGLQVRRDTCQQ